MLLLLSACAPGDDVKLDSGAGHDSATELPEPPSLTLTAPPAFDPIGGGPVTLDVTTDAETVALRVTGPDGSYLLEAPVPLSVPAGAYRVFAATPGDTRHAPSLSR